MAYKDLSLLPQSYQNQIKLSKFLLLQKEIPFQINLLAILFAKQNNVKTCLDCGGRDEEIPEEILSNLDYLSPN
jgi:hypothetical protein